MQDSHPAGDRRAENPTCWTCRWFDTYHRPDPGEPVQPGLIKGWCRFGAPVAERGFPEVDGDDWCSHHPELARKVAEDLFDTETVAGAFMQDVQDHLREAIVWTGTADMARRFLAEVTGRYESDGRDAPAVCVVIGADSNPAPMRDVRTALLAVADGGERG